MEKLFTILFKVPELQRKILMTAMFLAIYRVGYFIPLHVVNQAKLESYQNQLNQTAAGKVSGPWRCSAGRRSG